MGFFSEGRMNSGTAADLDAGGPVGRKAGQGLVFCHVFMLVKG
jgi:hypothetical protein